MNREGKGRKEMYRLLIADDEYIEREALKSIINRNFPDQFLIFEAANGLETVEKAKENHLDIIFVDIKMPGQSGIEAIKQIRLDHTDTEIVIITAYDYFDYAKEAISLKVSEFLIKPIDVSAVVTLVDTLLKKLEKKKEWQQYNFEMEAKLERVKTRYELEFMEMIQYAHTEPETVKEYLKIMDISFQKAVAVIIDFEKIMDDASVGKIQKEFICTRLLNRIKEQSEKASIKCMQYSEDQLSLLLLISEASATDDIVFGDEMTAFMEDNMRSMHTLATFLCSKVIHDVTQLPAIVTAFKQSCIVNKEKHQYPYELEEKLIISLDKSNFSDGRRWITEIAKELKKQGNSKIFQREVHALYAVVRRCLKNLSKDALMPDADELVSYIQSDYDMISFFHRLFEYAELAAETKVGKNKALVEKICRYIEEHYYEDLSWEDAASMIGFSPFYFSKLMKEYCNMSYVDYVSLVRVNKAKELFDTTDVTVAEVALQVGYADPNYFTRVFKKLTGQTPSRYRDKLK